VRLFRFPYSCFALKVQCLLDLAGLRADVEDVPYGDRSALVALTGGYLHVPVLVDDDGGVHLESRAISALIIKQYAPALVPSPLDGPVWAYADWCDQVLEEGCFKLAAPGIRRRFPRPVDRALYALIKERKYGAGCVELWEKSTSELLERTCAALEPSGRTLSEQLFLFGDEPTLADAALWGQLAMVRFAGVEPAALGSSLAAWVQRLEAVMDQRRGRGSPRQQEHVTALGERGIRPTPQEGQRPSPRGRVPRRSER
jgi:glutathione S-transferase